MAGAWWGTTDELSQWSVGCGGFSLRDRQKALAMTSTSACITPAAGRLEDQQLGASWRHIARRCARARLAVSKPSRHEAALFGIEYDLHMDHLPGEDEKYPRGCRAKYYTGPEYVEGTRRRKWDPKPMPADVQCENEPYVPMGCHKANQPLRPPNPRQLPPPNRPPAPPL